MISIHYKHAIKRYLSNKKIDLIMYSTPPITLDGVVKYAKNYYGAPTYLLLKDIFPQNAVDLEMFSKKGLKGIIYQYFRNKEKNLYDLSDYIGCMSYANVKYILKNNTNIKNDRVEVCPNSIEPVDMRIDSDVKSNIRNKYGIPNDKKVLVYGGNLGRPQGLGFLMDCIRSQVENENIYFLIVGDGTEYKQLEDFVTNEKTGNVKLMKRLPKDDYDKMIAACDVGLIFLDHRFTIPNFPSRILAYMQAALPVLAATDTSTDIGKVITDGEFGFWCESNDISGFSEIIKKIDTSDLLKLGENGRKYLEKYYTAENAYAIIANRLK